MFSKATLCSIQKEVAVSCNSWHSTHRIMVQTTPILIQLESRMHANPIRIWTLPVFTITE